MVFGKFITVSSHCFTVVSYNIQIVRYTLTIEKKILIMGQKLFTITFYIFLLSAVVETSFHKLSTISLLGKIIHWLVIFTNKSKVFLSSVKD